MSSADAVPMPLGAGAVVLKTGVATIGAVVGAGLVIGGAALVLSEVLAVGIALLIAVGVGFVVLGYVLAHFTAGSGFGEFMRGLLIGTNAGLNGVLASLVVGALAGTTAGYVVGASLGALNFIAVFGAVANSEFYQGVLGWLTWLLPMSWLVVALGLLFLVVSVLGHAIVTWIFRVDYFRIIGGATDWTTGTFFLHGGFVANLNYLDTAFNMGNFSFVDAKSRDMHIDHEAGHTLNLAAFGSVFHFVGAIDENVLGGRHNAFSERLAESNVPGTRQANIIPMWI